MSHDETDVCTGANPVYTNVPELTPVCAFFFLSYDLKCVVISRFLYSVHKKSQSIILSLKLLYGFYFNAILNVLIENCHLTPNFVFILKKEYSHMKKFKRSSKIRCIR